MHKNDLIKALAQKTGCLQKDADLFITNFLETIKETLQNDEKITLAGFGTFSTIKTKEKKGRNPQTGKEIKIPASKKVKFKVGKSLKEEVKKSNKNKKK